MQLVGHWGQKALGGFVAAGALLLVACGSTGATPTSTATATVDMPPARSAPAGCPRQLHRLPDKNRSARTELVPAGAASMLACRYIEQVGPGEASRRPTITERRIRSQGTISRLRTTLDGLPPISKGARSCPEPTTILRYLVVAIYENQPPVYARVVLAGCSSVSNGVDPTDYFPSRTLRRELTGVFR